jgi:predicted AAA+ superfamily ATPase
MFVRKLTHVIEKYLQVPEIIALIGPRQAGKTTLLRALYQKVSQQHKAVFLDFEDRDVLALFNEDIKTFAQLHVAPMDYLFIDEFQYAQCGGKQLKYLFDNYATKIFISGSSALELTHQAVKYLVGRVFILHLYPFDFSEYLNARDENLYQKVFVELREKFQQFLYQPSAKFPELTAPVHKQLLQHYAEFVVYGGYPRVVAAASTEEKIMVLKNIYHTYFLREIREILQLAQEVSLDKLIKALAHQVGALVNYHELCQVTQTTQQTLKQHLNILEKTYVVRLLSPYFTNKRLELVKTPKVYFIDSGLRNCAVDYFQPLTNRIDKGQLHENFVASQLFKQEKQVNYWRTKSQAEVDFVVTHQQQLLALEVKSQAKIKTPGKALLSFQQKYQPICMMLLSENMSFWDASRCFGNLPLYFI